MSMLGHHVRCMLSACSVTCFKLLDVRQPELRKYTSGRRGAGTSRDSRDRRRRAGRGRSNRLQPTKLLCSGLPRLVWPLLASSTVSALACLLSRSRRQAQPRAGTQKHKRSSAKAAHFSPQHRHPPHEFQPAAAMHAVSVQAGIRASRGRKSQPQFTGPAVQAAALTGWAQL